MKNIIFKFSLDSGKMAGTGHFFRCIKIYKILKKKYRTKLNFYFLFENYENSKKIIKKYIKENIVIYDKDFERKVSFLQQNDIIINDTPKNIDKKFLSFCERKNLKNLILIDHEKIKYKFNYLIINGIFFFKKKFSKKKNILQGPDYIILDKKFINLKKRKSKKFRILVTTGGTDNKQISIKIYNMLKILTNVVFYFIIGPGFKSNNPINKIKSKNVFLIKNETDLSKYYKKTDLSITSGGISMFESLVSGNVTLVTQLYKNQKYSIQYFKKKHIIYVIGKGLNIYKDKLIKIIYKFIKEKNRKTLSFSKKNNFVDGKSILRIEKILHKIIIKNN